MLDRVVIDICSQAFAQEQLYTALLRVQKPEEVLLLVVEHNKEAVTNDVVHHDKNLLL